MNTDNPQSKCVEFSDWPIFLLPSQLTHFIREKRVVEVDGYWYMNFDGKLRPVRLET